MNEAQWLACTDSSRMLHHLWRAPGRVGDRKRRLFICAARRREWGPLRDRRHHQALTIAERFADGLVDEADLQAGRHALVSMEMWDLWDLTVSMGDFDCLLRSRVIAGARHADLLREIVGNPFRPAPDLSPFRTPDVLALAWVAYGERGESGVLCPDRLGVLSDALEEAGCPAEECCPYCGGKGEWEESNRDGKGVVKWCPPCSGTGYRPHPLLAHLRGPGPHALGCWALDLALGKE